MPLNFYPKTIHVAFIANKKRGHMEKDIKGRGKEDICTIPWITMYNLIAKSIKPDNDDTKTTFLGNLSQ